MKAAFLSVAVLAAGLAIRADEVAGNGGTVSLAPGYRIHTFTESGTFEVTSGGVVDILLVGGGGGGGSSSGGGGGGGAVVYLQNVEVAAGPYTITVGSGGVGGTGAGGGTSPGTSGGKTEIPELSLEALGGGGGGGLTSASGKSGANGGGGSGYYAASATPTTGGAATWEFGFAGGGGTNTNYTYRYGAGGGGAGEAGHDAQYDAPGTSGCGGNGLACSITGREVFYGGGGGGGSADYKTASSKVRAGGLGGGGQGGCFSANGEDGDPNTGGGGGGGGSWGDTKGNGGAGGSGLVVIRYAHAVAPTFETAEGGTVSIVGDDQVHVFHSNGTFVVTGESSVDVLVVGGGGGGGTGPSGGGGGGAGGFVYRQNVPLLPGAYAITVGAGGKGAVTTGAAWNYSAGTTGEVSTAFGFVALGGGRGGTNGNGGSGACGGGGAGHNNQTPAAPYLGGSGVDGQGCAGGSSTNDNYTTAFGGGGGGAGEPGCNGFLPYALQTLHENGRGGDGLPCSITGREVYYCGGGGGGVSYTLIQDTVPGGQIGTTCGGRGGGGRGSARTVSSAAGCYPGTDGQPFTGGGGGGGGAGSPYCANGGNGGSGIVIVRCRARTKSWKDEIADVTGGVVRHRSPGHWTVHTFSGDGMFTLVEPTRVDLLVVGGGGGGGRGRGGGGGAGQVLVFSNLVLNAGTYPVTVGAGGAGDSDGKPSRFGLYEALGGGGGGYTNIGGRRGASGGGGGGSNLGMSGKSYWGGDAWDGCGHPGGVSTNNTASSVSNYAMGGGGGGAGERGHDGSYACADDSLAGCGGNGVPCDFSGVMTYYGGGGGAGQGNVCSARAGGLGGGGAGGKYLWSDQTHPSAGSPGQPLTGGGGGGGGANGDYSGAGGQGGSGVVIVRYHHPAKGLMMIVR